jgi:hypothetical protein
VNVVDVVVDQANMLNVYEVGVQRKTRVVLDQKTGLASAWILLQVVRMLRLLYAKSTAKGRTGQSTARSDETSSEPTSTAVPSFEVPAPKTWSQIM